MAGNPTDSYLPFMGPFVISHPETKKEGREKKGGEGVRTRFHNRVAQP